MKDKTIKKYLKEDISNLPELRAEFSKTYKLIREFDKKVRALEKQFEKDKTALGKGIVETCQKEIDAIKKENKYGLDDIDLTQAIADELYVIFEGEEQFMDMVDY